MLTSASANLRPATDHQSAAPEHFGRPSIAAIDHADTGIGLFEVAALHGPQPLMTSGRHAASPDMLMITRGSGKRAEGRFAGTPFSVAPSRAIRVTFTPYGADSYTIYHPSSHSFGLTFPRGFLQNLSPDPVGYSSPAPLIFGSDDQLARLADSMRAEIAVPGFASSVLIDGISRAIGVALLRIDPVVFAREADRIQLPAWKLRRVIDYIDANLESDITVGDLAMVADLSTFHFARVFKRAAGVSPYQFVRDRRIERSRALLIENKLAISQLALACGFASQSHFTAAFTRAIGKSPGRFRRESRV